MEEQLQYCTRSGASFGLASRCLAFGSGILKDTGLVCTVAERSPRLQPSLRQPTSFAGQPILQLYRGL